MLQSEYILFFICLAHYIIITIGWTNVGCTSNYAKTKQNYRAAEKKRLEEEKAAARRMVTTSTNYQVLYLLQLMEVSADIFHL